MYGKVEKNIKKKKQHYFKMKKLKVLSLFDGISVAQQAIKELGYDVEYWASEIDKYAIQLTQKNHPNTKQLGSVVDIKKEMVGEIDLLIGGSPCQDLSIAGKRAGLSGARSGLFYEYVRIRDEVKPKYFILENVNSMPKEARDTISKELGVQPVMINASLVSAQNRKRLFWVGKLQEDGTYKQVEISQPEDKGILLKDILESEVDEKYKVIATQLNMSKQFGNSESDKGKAFTLRASNPNGIKLQRIGQIGKGGQGDRIYSPDGKSVGLSALGCGGGAKTGLYEVPVIVKNQGRDIVKEIDKSHTLMARDYKGFGNQEMTGIYYNNNIRKLTPIECERLQSLPDGYTEGVSNSQRYKGLGNAFNCEVIKHIIKNICK